MTEAQQTFCSLIRAALWGETVRPAADTDWEAVFEEVSSQRIFLLFSDLIPTLPLPEELRTRWKEKALRQFSFNCRLLSVQAELEELLEGLPHAVLKGSAAAVSYPRPLLRTMGDIDLIVRPENVEEACDRLVRGGFTRESSSEGSRVCPLRKENVLLELHSRFAILTTKEAEDTLDGWIRDALGEASLSAGSMLGEPFSMLGEPLNGLVLLAHISQHLEDGLGMRQILDWMMYAGRCLTKENWPDFLKESAKIGLDTLAVPVTDMCSRYLGLPDISGGKTDESLCEALMEYLFACGNFGTRQGMNNTAAAVLSHGRGFTGFFRNLQQRGEANWTALKKYPWLKGAAWIYQGIRYARIAFSRENALGELRKDVAESKRRNELLDRLGAKQASKRR